MSCCCLGFALGRQGRQKASMSGHVQIIADILQRTYCLREIAPLHVSSISHKSCRVTLHATKKASQSHLASWVMGVKNSIVSLRQKVSQNTDYDLDAANNCAFSCFYCLALWTIIKYDPFFMRHQFWTICLRSPSKALPHQNILSTICNVTIWEE